MLNRSVYNSCKHEDSHGPGGSPNQYSEQCSRPVYIHANRWLIVVRS